MTLLRGAAALVVSMLVMVASPVAAEDGGEPLSPPLVFTATYNHTLQEIRLQWEPPADGAAYSYNLYQSGVLIDSISQTNYSIVIDPGSTLVNAMHVFQVTAQRGDVEGPPTPPLLLLRGPLDDYMPPRCELVIFFIDPDEIPPIDWVVDDACKEGWGRYIEYLLGELIGPVLQASSIHESIEG